MELYEVNGKMKLLRYYGELSTRFDSRQSFYGKAKILTDSDNNYYLLSYSTVVSVSKNGKVEHFGKWSQTTTRHQKEFEKQFTFNY